MSVSASFGRLDLFLSQICNSCAPVYILLYVSSISFSQVRKFELDVSVVGGLSHVYKLAWDPRAIGSYFNTLDLVDGLVL